MNTISSLLKRLWLNPVIIVSLTQGLSLGLKVKAVMALAKANKFYLLNGEQSVQVSDTTKA